MWNKKLTRLLAYKHCCFFILEKDTQTCVPGISELSITIQDPQNQPKKKFNHAL